MPLTPAVIWLLVGVFLCVMEMVVPTAFVEFTMGISAIAVGLLSFAIPSIGIQVFLWMVLSLILTLLTRRFIPKRRSHTLEDAKEAQALTAFSPGELGRVLYEGNSWQARCEGDVAIAPQQRVLVVGRRGTLLLVVSETALLERMKDEG